MTQLPGAPTSQARWVSPTIRTAGQYDALNAVLGMLRHTATLPHCHIATLHATRRKRRRCGVGVLGVR